MAQSEFKWPSFLDVSTREPRATRQPRAPRMPYTMQTASAAFNGGASYLLIPLDGSQPTRLLTVTDNCAAATGLLYQRRYYPGKIRRIDAHTVELLSSLTPEAGPWQISRTEGKPVIATPCVNPFSPITER